MIWMIFDIVVNGSQSHQWSRSPSSYYRPDTHKDGDRNEDWVLISNQQAIDQRGHHRHQGVLKQS